MTVSNTVRIYTDGACKGNPGPGGWAALLVHGPHEKVVSGAQPATTNNRMELTAAIRGLQALRRPCKVDLFTDSQYVRNGITQWLPNWRRRNWLTASRTPVKNADLWRELDAEAARHEVSWHWVRGHSGHPENERVDQLARDAIATLNEV